MVDSDSRRFKKIEDETGVIFWRGDPDCDAGHQEILVWLRKSCQEFLPSVTSVGNILKGNMGETMSYYIGNTYVFDNTCKAFPANAFNPFGNIAKSDLDIVWIHFGERPLDDFIVLQEVKTTGEDDLAYANRLLDDYDKLFGVDPQLTLQTRLQQIKNQLEYGLHAKPLADRVSVLAGQSPATSPRVRLLPTVVHDMKAPRPGAKLAAIRTTLIAKGWVGDTVEAWSIALSDLEARISRLAMGQR